MESKLKRFVSLFCLCSLFFPFAVSAAMIKLEVNCKPTYEKSEFRVDIKDGFWNFPVIEIPKEKEKEQYSVVIEGYESVETKNERIILAGAEFSRRNILFPKDGILTIENKESFERKITLMRDGGSEPTVLNIQPESVVQQKFTEDGDYTVTDNSFSWNTFFVKVLKTRQVWTLKEGGNTRTIPDIAPGSYTLKIYYGTRWIYQEDFMVVQNAAQVFTYKIENGKVVNLNSYSTSMD